VEAVAVNVAEDAATEGAIAGGADVDGEEEEEELVEDGTKICAVREALPRLAPDA